MIIHRGGRGRGRSRVFAACFLAAVSLSLGFGSAAHGAPQAVPSAAATVKPPHLDFKTTVLPNGLKVVTLEDHRAPVVTIQVWYRVGSKDEPSGQFGFAHLFEHLMFKGSKNVGPEQHSRYVEDVGGAWNADTFIDRTRYYETVPSNALKRMLFLEADRMATLNVDQKNLDSERKVVEEEYRLRVANAPYGSWFPDLQKLVFTTGHPYGHSTIGSLADLDAANLAQVRAFHDEYYKPNNATLVLVGDFDTKEALATVREDFGPIPKGTKPFKRLPVPADTQKAERVVTTYDRLAPLPRVTLAYRLPEPKSPDTPVFDILQQVLTAGESSRLYRAVVREQPLALNIDGGAQSLMLGGVFYLSATGAAGKDPKALETALQSQMARLAAEPISADELTRAKNQALSDMVFSNISTPRKASTIGETDLMYGTPDELNRYFSQIAAVTAADVQRVARTYFAPEHTDVLYVLPAAMKDAKETK